MTVRVELPWLAALLASALPGCWSDTPACSTDPDCPGGSCVDGACVEDAPACTFSLCAGRCGEVDDGCGGTHLCACDVGESCTLTAGTPGGLCGPTGGCDNYCNDVPDGLGGTLDCACAEGLHCNAARPAVGECCQPLSCDAAHECGLLHDDCTGQDVSCGCSDPGSRCLAFPGRCEPCGCAPGELCRPDGVCGPPAEPRCWGELQEVHELSDGEANAVQRNDGFPSLTFVTRQGSTWLYFLSARWVTDAPSYSDVAEVRLTSATSADPATLARVPLDAGGPGWKYHLSAPPDGSELLLSTAAPGPEGWMEVRTLHSLPQPDGSWSAPEWIDAFGVHGGVGIYATLLPDRRTAVSQVARDPFSARVARRPTAAPTDVAFEDVGEVDLDPAGRWRANGPSCDGLGLFYVIELTAAIGTDEPRYAPIISYEPLTFGAPQQLSLPRLPRGDHSIAVAETPDCAALWLWIEGHLYAAPRIPCP